MGLFSSLGNSLSSLDHNENAGISEEQQGQHVVGKCEIYRGRRNIARQEMSSFFFFFFLIFYIHIQ